MTVVADSGEAATWQERPLLLATIGAVAALLAWALLDRGTWPNYDLTPLPIWRTSLAAGILTGALGFGFTVERVRWQWTVGFGVIVGVIAALVLVWNGDPDNQPYKYFWDWRSASLFLAIAIAAPLFQSAREEGAARWPYAEVHSHAWTNVVLWFACWMFVGVTVALAYLLAALFDLIGLKFLTELLRKGWFFAPLSGAAFGAALGLFRERDRVVRLLQFVVTAVSSVLAPVLAAGLAVFLLALPFTGLSALWEATRSTTPILLSCVIGALILSNAVIGNGTREEEPRNPVLRWAAIVLAVEILPLALIAAIATGLRIRQYGFTPDRLWALTFVIVATAYGLAYLVSVVRGRVEWAALVRPANLRLGFALCALTLLLALPVISFNAISAGDQVARLEGGKIKADRFDWAALAFDFGEPGRTALKRLAASRDVAISAPAKLAASKTSRYDIAEPGVELARREQVLKQTRVLPTAVPLPDGLVAILPEWNVCAGVGAGGACLLLYTPGADQAVTVAGPCVGRQREVMSLQCQTAKLVRDETGKWKVGEKVAPKIADADLAAVRAASAAGQVEIHPVTRRQVFIGGRPVGDPFD